MKRILFLCLTALCVLTTWAGRNDKYDFSVDGIYYYKLSDGSVAVIDSAFQVATSTYTGDLVIPASVEYEGTTYTVSSIFDYAFYRCNLTTISIPETVTSFGISAFSYCSQLTELTIPYGFTEIAGDLCNNSTALSSVTIPNTVTQIGAEAFCSCTSLKEIVIPESVTTIGDFTFMMSGLSKLYSLNHNPPTVDVSYGGFAFYGITSICTLYVPKGCVEVYSSADQWKDFTSIVEIDETITPPTVTTIAVTDITNSTATLYGTVSAGSEEILEKGFQYWADVNAPQTIVATSVSDDEISSTIQRLSSATEYTFRAYATTATETHYGESMTFTTTDYDFAEDNSEGHTIYYKILSNSGSNRTCEVQYLYYMSTDNIVAYEGELTIPETVTHEGTTYNVIQINEYTFYECRNLTKVTTPKSVTAIGPSSFRNCTSLEEVILPENSSFARIWYYSFSGCSSLKNLTIPNSVTTIDQQAFEYTGLETLTIPNSIKTIDSYAFQYTSLEEITIPSTVEYVGHGAFRYCASLNKIRVECDIPEYYTFTYCENLEDVTITTSVVDIGHYTFRYCDKLKSIVIPNSVASIGDYTFAHCNALKDVTLPSNLTNVSDGAFFSCEEVEEISIPESVTTIGHETFMTCQALKKITFPKNVTSIGGRVCNTCPSLMAIYSLNPTPPSCDNDWYATDGWFDGINNECVLYVPTGSKETYSTASVWKDFFKDDMIVEIDVLSAKTNEATGITDNSAILNGSITKGTFDVTDKGFEYWTDPITPTAISIEGDEMTNTLSSLEPCTTYYYRAYATDTTGTTYGETLSFTTDVPEGISSVKFEFSDVEGYYTTSGLKLNTPQKGINIVRYTDGTTKKVIMK